MNDEDEKLKNNLFIVFIVILVFGIPLLVYFAKPATKNIIQKLINDETFVMVITENNCPKCKMAKSVLKDNEIKMYELNKDKNSQYEEVLRELRINNKKNDFPIIVYVEKGENKGSLFSIKTEKDIKDFIIFNKLNQNRQ